MPIYGDFMYFANYRPNYLTVRNPGNLPSFPTEYEPCGAQMSLAFHRSGDPLDGLGYPCQETMLTVPRYFTYDGVTCIVSVPELYWYLKGRYEDPENHRGSESDLRSKLAGRFGIVAFGWRHIDIWADQGLYDTVCPYDISGLFNDVSVAKRGLFFWEIQDSTASDF